MAAVRAQLRGQNVNSVLYASNLQSPLDLSTEKGTKEPLKISKLPKKICSGLVCIAVPAHLVQEVFRNQIPSALSAVNLSPPS